MGKKRGHGGHGRHGHHGYGYGFGMPPMPHIPPMHGIPGMAGPSGPGFGGGPHVDPNQDPRINCRPGCPPMRPDFRHMFGRHFRGPPIVSSTSSSSSSDSSSDSDTKCKKKCDKRKRRHFKHWHQLRQMMSDPNWNKTQCTLCWRQIRPLAETEVLECGHIYHRLCLKELFSVSQTGDNPEIFCTQCRQQIDTDLVTELQNRFNGETQSAPQTNGQQVIRGLENLKVK